MVVMAAIGLRRAWPAASVTPHGVPDAAYPLWSFWHFAYSDIVALYTTRGLYLHLWPYIQVPLEYPPGIGVYLWLTSWAPHVSGYLVVNAMALTAAAIGAAFVAAAVVGWRTVRLWAFSPLLMIYLIYNWDALGILTYALAALQFHRRRWWWAGLWIGVGISTKLFPIVLLPFMGLERWRAGDREAVRQLVGAAVGAFVVINAPFAALNPLGWATFWTMNAGRGPSPGIWQWLVQHHWLGIVGIDALSFLLLGAAAVWLALAVWKGSLPPLAAAALLLTFWFLTNKVYSPQYVLWALFALVMADSVRGTAWMLAVTGYLDFALAMLWLATGYGHSPWEPTVASYLAPLTILVRYATFVTILVRGRPMAWVARRAAAM
jgi:hypothetical protein